MKLKSERRPRRGKMATRHFAYFNARVYAMRGKLIPKEQYTKFLQMGIGEIARYLGETEYKTEIEALGKRYRGVNLVEYSLNRNLAKTFHGLIRKAQGELQELITLYMTYYDLENIYTILRGELSGIHPDEIKESLIPAGDLEEPVLNQLIDAPYEEMLDRLHKMGYEGAVEMLREGRPLAEVEDRMRRDYYRDLLEATEVGGGSMEMFRRHVRVEIDFTNLINLLRLRRDRESPEKTLEYMVEGGLELPMPRLRELAGMEMEDLLSAIEGLPYFSEAARTLISAADNLTALEAMLIKFEADHTAKQARQNPLTIQVVLAYVQAKRIEVDNIRIIARGKEGELPTDLIRMQLVI